MPKYTTKGKTYKSKNKYERMMRSEGKKMESMFDNW
jgi:hypothetical protein